MSDQIILNLITTITMFCGQFNDSKACFKKIWMCGHNVSTPMVIPSETHNCITTYLKDVK